MNGHVHVHVHVHVQVQVHVHVHAHLQVLGEALVPLDELYSHNTLELTKAFPVQVHV